MGNIYNIYVDDLMSLCVCKIHSLDMVLESLCGRQQEARGDKMSGNLVSVMLPLGPGPFKPRRAVTSQREIDRHFGASCW